MNQKLGIFHPGMLEGSPKSTIYFPFAAFSKSNHEGVSIIDPGRKIYRGTRAAWTMFIPPSNRAHGNSVLKIGLAVLH
jgi:hypothetical protein